MLRILWVTQQYRWGCGGIQTMGIGILNELVKSNIVKVIGGSSFLSAIKNINLVEAQSIGRPESSREFARIIGLLNREINSFYPDIVHYSDGGLSVYNRELNTNIPAVAHIHGNDLTMPWQLAPDKNVKAEIIEGLNSCTVLVCLSQFVKNLAQSLNVTASINKLYPGVDAHYCKPRSIDIGVTIKKLRLPENRKFILTVGRLIPRKGHTNILSALSFLSDEYHWIIVGPSRGYLGEFWSQVKRKGLQKKVTYFGEVTLDILLDLYKLSKIFVMTPNPNFDPEDLEGFGLVFLEAAAMNLPVIGSDTGGCPEALRYCPNSECVPPEDPEKLANAIKKLTNDESIFHYSSGKVLFPNAWHSHVQELESIYNNIHDSSLICS